MRFVPSTASPQPLDYRPAALRYRSRTSAGGLLSASFVHLGLLIAALISLTPFVWLLCASIKRGEDLFAYTFLPLDHLDRLSAENFTELFRREAFGRWLINSFTSCSIFCGVGFSRLRDALSTMSARLMTALSRVCGLGPL